MGVNSDCPSSCVPRIPGLRDSVPGVAHKGPRGTLPMFPSDFETRHDKMVESVETTLKLHRDLPKAKTPHEQESLQRQIAATDGQIDALVYELYGLTGHELQIAEGAP